ncbi:Ribose 5-phosphate isomerase B [Bacillus badius]|uniref:Ribose 5-phosphate isomerase B n=1 Tax=Bacillus badius TaxID=1455 RepID=A0ABR5AUH0_BACBA|nr:Ribose 5-phosphate isomerase B [Bacillus badius]KIL78810.1 Ribose 5-phosphate isomerase B [Bacillus badius]
MEGAKTPAGSAGQVRPRTRFGAEEAHRPPRGKRSSLEWKTTDPSAHQIKRTADFSFSSLIIEVMIPSLIRTIMRLPIFFNPVDWNGRREDSCGISGTGETPQTLSR